MEGRNNNLAGDAPYQVLPSRGSEVLGNALSHPILSWAAKRFPGSLLTKRGWAPTLHTYHSIKSPAEFPDGGYHVPGTGTGRVSSLERRDY